MGENGGHLRSPVGQAANLLTPHQRDLGCSIEVAARFCQLRRASRSFANRFRLSPFSAASIASSRCSCGVIRTLNLPENLRSANGLGTDSPDLERSATTSA